MIYIYIELYVWLVVDLIFNVVLVVGFVVDCEGNVYIGLSMEDILVLVEFIVFSDGIVIV